MKACSYCLHSAVCLAAPIEFVRYTFQKLRGDRVRFLSVFPEACPLLPVGARELVLFRREYVNRKRSLSVLTWPVVRHGKVVGSMRIEAE